MVKATFSNQDIGLVYSPFIFLRGIDMKESQFQKKVVDRIKEKYSSAIILKNDPNYIQGIPDLLILYKGKWCALECKIKKNAHRQPNQVWYVDKLNAMSFASFIFPENMEEVLNDIFHFFGEEEEIPMKLHNIVELDRSNKKFKEGSHALFSASKYHWINYSEEKMVELYTTEAATKRGTKLHAIAAKLIEEKIALPRNDNTLNLYVNDAILLDLKPEFQIYYSEFFFGTADALGLIDGVLRIHDFKSGKSRVSMNQLYIYLAFFCLEYHTTPNDFKDVVLRIYQSGDFVEEHPKNDIICPIMDKVVTVNKILMKMKEEE